MKIVESELYSSFKASHHLERIDALRRGELIAPTHIQIDLTNKCNHDCKYCFYRGVNSNIVTQFDEKAVMPFNTFKAVIEEMKRLEIPAIQITGGGEPLMYPDFLNVMDLLNSTELEVALVTNGALLSDKIIDRLHKLAWIRISIDAATSETYGIIQNCNPNEFEKVLNNIDKLVKRLTNTVIGISFIVSPENYKEIYEAVKLYKSLGVHNVRFSIAYTKDQTKIFEPFMSEMFELTRQAKKLNEENFRIFDLNLDHMVHLGAKKQYKVCGYSHFTVAIEANGAVRPCCTMKGLPHSNFGNLKEQSFGDIWFGERRKKWLKHFNSSKCELCWMDSKNLFIEYIINEEPMHVNFV